jgi:hypothetical protein
LCREREREMGDGRWEMRRSLNSKAKTRIRRDVEGEKARVQGVEERERRRGSEEAKRDGQRDN